MGHSKKNKMHYTNKRCKKNSIVEKTGWNNMGSKPSSTQKDICRILEYGIAVWGTTAKSNFKEMARIQNQNLRIITGGMKSTPVKEMEAVTGLQSLEDRRTCCHSMPSSNV